MPCYNRACRLSTAVSTASRVSRPTSQQAKKRRKPEAPQTNESLDPLLPHHRRTQSASTMTSHQVRASAAVVTLSNTYPGTPKPNMVYSTNINYCCAYDCTQTARSVSRTTSRVDTTNIFHSNRDNSTMLYLLDEMASDHCRRRRPPPRRHPSSRLLPPWGATGHKLASPARA